MNLYDNSFVLCETSDTKNDAICMSLGNIEGAGRGWQNKGGTALILGIIPYKVWIQLQMLWMLTHQM